MYTTDRSTHHHVLKVMPVPAAARHEPTATESSIVSLTALDGPPQQQTPQQSNGERRSFLSPSPEPAELGGGGGGGKLLAAAESSLSVQGVRKSWSCESGCGESGAVLAAEGGGGGGRKRSSCFCVKMSKTNQYRVSGWRRDLMRDELVSIDQRVREIRSDIV